LKPFIDVVDVESGNFHVRCGADKAIVARLFVLSPASVGRGAVAAE